MANKYLTYILVLLCLCCAVNAHAQTDTSVAQMDSVVVDSSIAPADKNNNDSYESTTESSNAVDKFSKKDAAEEQRTVNERNLSSAKVQQMKKGKENWYADKPANKSKKEENKKGLGDYIFNLMSSPVWHVVFWVIVIGAFLLLVILVLRTFTGGSRKLKTKEIAAEDIQENIFTTDFDEQLNKALNAHNYRLATRLLFLRVLRSMSEKSVINYGRDKTNMDYIFELGNTKYAKDFMQASRAYEYVWYGNFDIKQTQFLHVRRLLDDLNQKISN